jgi:hypothetical protein
MTTILNWLRGTQQKEAIEDDWLIVEDIEREEDMASSIATIEPAVPTTDQAIKIAVDNRIAELQKNKKYTLRNELAQLKDKELKLRKLQKLQKRI